MKKWIPIVLVFMVGQMHAQRTPKIKGNKSVVEVSEPLPPFSALVLEDDLEVVLQKASEEGYILNADDNLIDVLKFEVRDSTLFISSFYKITAKKTLDIQVNYKELTSITLKSGKLSTNELIASDELHIETMGPARVELNSNAEIIHLTMGGISSGDFNLASDSLSVQLKDRIDARIYTVGGGALISMDRNATARLEGTTDNLYVRLSGNAHLKAERLEAKEVDAALEASSNARINAIDKTVLSMRENSKTQLYGNPKIEIKDFLDASQLLKRTD